MKDKISSLIEAMTDLEIEKGKQASTIRELEQNLGKLHVDIRALKHQNDSQQTKLFNMESEVRLMH